EGPVARRPGVTSSVRGDGGARLRADARRPLPYHRKLDVPRSPQEGKEAEGWWTPMDAFALRRTRGWSPKGPHDAAPLHPAELAAAGEVGGDGVGAGARAGRLQLPERQRGQQGGYERAERKRVQVAGDRGQQHKHRRDS